MKINKLLILFFSAVYIIGCTSENNPVTIDRIQVAYVLRHSDYIVPLDCGMLIAEPGYFDTCTLQNKENLNIIYKLLKNMKISDMGSKSIPDIRIQCRINYNNMSDDTLCFGEWDTTVLNGQIMQDNDTLTYLIKKSINYYDTYEPKELLKNMPEYRKFQDLINIGLQ